MANSTIAEKIAQAESERQRITANIAAAYDAAEAKGATMPATENSANLADTVASIQQGSGIDYSKPVEFIDYDGTVLYTYTREEALNLSALPLGVEHEGLTFQEWNWSLQGIKNYLAHHQFVIVGATYTINDGQNHSFWKTQRLSRNTKCESELWFSNNPTSVYGYNLLEKILLSKNVTLLKNQSIFSALPLKALVIPKGCNVEGSIAWDCGCLEKVSLPETLISTASKPYNGFLYNSQVKKISFPDNISGMYGSVFESCRSLKEVEFPRGLGSFSEGFIFYGASIDRFVLPSSLTYIASNITINALGLAAIVVLGKPQLGGQFPIPTFCKIYVHQADMEWYSTATNWSSLYDDYIVAIEDNRQELLDLGIDISIYE